MSVAKEEKARGKLVARIVSLEQELKHSLQKKSSSAAEINMPAKLAEIQRLKKELQAS